MVIKANYLATRSSDRETFFYLGKKKQAEQVSPPFRIRNCSNSSFHFLLPIPVYSSSLTTRWRFEQESNPYQQYRKLLSYPLDYRSISDCARPSDLKSKGARVNYYSFTAGKTQGKKMSGVRRNLTKYKHCRFPTSAAETGDAAEYAVSFIQYPQRPRPAGNLARKAAQDRRGTV